MTNDYDMLVRSILCTRYVAIPDLSYIQYRNQNGDNSTFHRNKQIQILVKELYNYYFKRIDARLYETLQKGVEINFKHMEVVIVGRIPTEVELFIAKAPMGAVRWWSMEPTDPLETCIRYAKYCASCRKKVVVFSESLEE